MSRSLTVLFVLWMCSSCNSARILGVFPSPARSHYILGSSLMRGLAEAGHDVTVISAFGEEEPPKNGTYRDIILTGVREERERMYKERSLFDMTSMNLYFMQLVIGKMTSDSVIKILNHTNVQNLLRSNEHFDVVIVEEFLVDGIFAFANYYNAPLIIFSTIGANLWVNPKVGNSNSLAYVPHVFLSYSSDMTFWERLDNVMLTLTSNTVYYFYSDPIQSQAVNHFFPSCPDYDLIQYNASLVLLNSHPSINQAVPHVPSMVEIGGFHIKPPKKLPADLQEFLDNAKVGVVYFSLGSNSKSKDLHVDKRNALLEVFSKLKHKVLWKWEDEQLPGKPENVKIAQWLPQSDILAHPNVKLFITHGGLLSTSEAIYYGVPLLAIPIFGDQRLNAEHLVRSGMALQLSFAEISEDKLMEKVNQLLNDPKYTRMAKSKSALFHDRPVKPMDEAIYWVEYVIRHRGASHLRVGGLDLPWYKYHLIDVIAFLFVLSVICIYTSYVVVRRVLRSFFSKKLPHKKLKNN